MRALLSAGRRAAHSALSFTKSPAEVSSSLLPSLKSVAIQQTSVSPTFVGTHPLLNVSEQCIIPINTTASNNTPSALGSLGSVLVLGTIVSMNNKVNDPTRCAGIDGPLTASQKNEMGKPFDEKLEKSLSEKDGTAYPLTKEAYDLRVNVCHQHNEGKFGKQLKELSDQAPKYVKTFQLLNIGSVPKLIYRPKTNASGDMPALVDHQTVSNTDTVFEDITRAYISEGSHLRTEKLTKKCRQFHGLSIPGWMCKAYVECCPICQANTRRKKMKAGSQPIVTRGMFNHGQIDLIDFQSMPDGPFKYLLNYEDHGGKLQVLHPLSAKTCCGVALFCLTCSRSLVHP